jgi:hypothetical protein
VKEEKTFLGLLVDVNAPSVGGLILNLAQVVPGGRRRPQARHLPREAGVTPLQGRRATRGQALLKCGKGRGWTDVKNRKLRRCLRTFVKMYEKFDCP